MNRFAIIAIALLVSCVSVPEPHHGELWSHWAGYEIPIQWFSWGEWNTPVDWT